MKNCLSCICLIVFSFTLSNGQSQNPSYEGNSSAQPALSVANATFHGSFAQQPIYPNRSKSSPSPTYSSAGSLISPEVSKQFMGNLENGFYPSDNSIAISSQGWIVSVVNSSISYYFEDGSVALNSEDLNSFYAFLDFPGSYSNPRVIYDPAAGRFILAALIGLTPETSRLVVSFSHSQNPAEGWWTYSIEDVGGSSTLWARDLQIGISDQDLFLTGNLFDSSNELEQSIILYIDKNLGYQGQNLSYCYLPNFLYGNGQTGWTVTPVSNVSGQGDIYMLASRADGGDSLQLITIKGHCGSFDLIVQTAMIPVATYNIGSHGPQSGTSKLLDVGDCRIQSAFYYGDTIYYVQHDRLVNNTNGIRFGKLSIGTRSHTFQRYGIPGSTLAYPAVAPFFDGNGALNTILAGFCQTSASQFPSYNVLTISNNFSFSNPILVKGGESSVTVGNNNIAPWGEYSGICMRHDTPIPTAWVFGSFGKDGAFSNWIAEITPLGSGPNNPCELAELLVCGVSISGNTSGSNPQNLQVCGGNISTAPGKWYRLVGTGSNVTLSTCSNLTNFNTKLSVFTGSCINLVCLTGVDDAGCAIQPSNAIVNFFAADGEEYFIYVTGAGSASGAYELTASCLQIPPSCAGGQSITSCSGSISDGSGPSAYSNNLACTWLIDPPGNDALTLTFSEFNTEANFDVVWIYDGVNANGILLDSLSGNSLPDMITASSGSIYILFETDGSANDSGWSATYQCASIQPPIAAFTANPISGNAPLSVDFVNTSSNANSYFWNFPGANPTNSTLINPQNVIYSTPGTYTVTLTATGPGGTASQTLTITVGGTSPDANFLSSTTCIQVGSNNSIQFTDISSNSPSSWLWSFPGGVPATSTAPNPVVSYSTPGVYDVSLTVNNALGISSITKNAFITVVDVKVQPTNGDTLVCLGESILLSATGASNFIWQGPGLNGSGATVSATPTTSGTAIYTIIGSTGNCADAPVSISLQVNPLPVVSILLSTNEICEGESIAMVAQGADTYKWTGLGLNTTTGDNVIATPTASGTFAYTVKGTSNSCISLVQTVNIVVKAAPDVHLTSSASEICVGEQITLIASGASQYYWVGAGIPPDAGAVVQITPNIPGVAGYIVIGTGANGCIGQNSIQVTVQEEPTVLPSANPSTICLGSTVMLSASGAESYQWSGIGLLSGSGQNVLAIPDQTGTLVYEVFGINAGSCQGPVSEITVTVIDNPISVTVVQSGCPGNTLTYEAQIINGGTINNITWFLNGEIVWAGPTYTYINAQTGSQIYCTVEPQNGPPCAHPTMVSSEPITVGCVPVQDAVQGITELRLMPNPNNGTFLLSLNVQEFTRLQVRIFNSVGQIQQNQSLELMPGGQKWPFDLSACPAGMYRMEISSGESHVILPVIKN